MVIYCNNSFVYGIEVIKAGHNGMWLMGHNNRIENCKFHDGGDAGFKVGSHFETNYPRNNLIVNCDSYRNYDTKPTAEMPTDLPQNGISEAETGL